MTRDVPYSSDSAQGQYHPLEALWKSGQLFVSFEIVFLLSQAGHEVSIFLPHPLICWD